MSRVTPTPIGDLQHRQMVGRGEDDLRPLDMFHGLEAIRIIQRGR